MKWQVLFAARLISPLSVNLIDVLNILFLTLRGHFFFFFFFFMLLFSYRKCPFSHVEYNYCVFYKRLSPCLPNRGSLQKRWNSCESVWATQCEKVSLGICGSEGPDQTARMPSRPLTELLDTVEWYNAGQIPGANFAHVQDDVNPHILRMLEGFSLDAAQSSCKRYRSVIVVCSCRNSYNALSSTGPRQAEQCLQACVKRADPDHPAHALSLIRIFPLYWQII